VVEINDEGALYEKERQRTLEKADTVVIALGQVPDNHLLEILSREVPEIYAVGDVVKRGKIMDAVHSAAEIARKI
jgi:thioredoxin reductase